MAQVARPVNREFVEHVFVAAASRCQTCGSKLSIFYQRERCVERLDGLHILTMKDRCCPDRQCPGHSKIVRPPEELLFVLKFDTLGLDVLFEIGERRLQDHMSFAAIHKRLRSRGVELCEKTVSNAFERFVALASCCDGESEEAKAQLLKQGGIIPIIDGVQFDNHSPVLYVVSDAISHMTLFAERHEVRSAKALKALLERIKALGVPVLGVVSDKEKGLVPAIQKTFPKVPHQFCQLHFVKRCAAGLDKSLAELGEEVDKVGKKVRELKRELKQAGATKSPQELKVRKLAEELLLAAHAASKVSGRAPFDPPALKRHERLQKVSEAATRAAKKGGPGRSSKRSCKR